MKDITIFLNFHKTQNHFLFNFPVLSFVILGTEIYFIRIINILNFNWGFFSSFYNGSKENCLYIMSYFHPKSSNLYLTLSGTAMNTHPYTLYELETEYSDSGDNGTPYK